MKTLPPAIAMLIEAAGGVPEPYLSDMQWRRFHHQDLPDLHDDELDGERVMVGVARAALTVTVSWAVTTSWPGSTIGWPPYSGSRSGGLVAVDEGPGRSAHYGPAGCRLCTELRAPSR